MENKEAQNTNGEPQEQKPELDRAYTMAAILSWVFFLALLSAIAYFRQSLFAGVAIEPGFRSAFGEALGICGIVGICGMLGIIIGNGIVSLLLPRTLEHAVSYGALIDLVGYSNEKKILNLIRLHELRVYAAGMKNAEEVENLSCRIVPLYFLPIYDKPVRWALSPFQKIFFDRAELEELFDENLDVLRRARPEKLMEAGTIAKQLDREFKMLMLRKEKYRGVKGRLESLSLQNKYCRLHAVTITLLTRNYFEKWPAWETKTEKLITHPSIEKLTGDILAEQPALSDALVALRVKGNPWLPDAMEDFFRYAMPDEMVDWGKEKLTLEYLIEKHLKGGDESQENDAPDDEQKDE